MFIVVGQIVVINITNDYKSALLEHDYNIAGYLNSMGVDKSKYQQYLLLMKINIL